MLQVNGISKRYGANVVLSEVSFALNRGDRVGLVGPNGCGKSTLLRIIAGLEPHETGHVSLAPSATLGYLAQGMSLNKGLSVGEEVQSGVKGLDSAQGEMERLASRIAETQGKELDNLLQAYGDAQARFEAFGGYEIGRRVETVLHGLGLSQVDLNIPVDRLSGGQRTRLGLARILLLEPDLLLLDEPTNHLDIEALEWLEQFLF